MERTQQIKDYKKSAALRQGTCCRAMGCRRFFGRKGFFFCTEGCNHCDRKAGEPAPPPEVYDLDDDCDASTVLLHVLGPPPPNVIIRRWRYDPEKAEHVLETYPENEEVTLESAVEVNKSEVVPEQAAELTEGPTKNEDDDSGDVEPKPHDE